MAASETGRLEAGDTKRIAGRRVFAFAGIADNDDFKKTVQDLNCDLRGFMGFADHHRYTERDVAALLVAARQSGAELVCTTEKDAVRMDPHRQWPLDLAVIGVRISFGSDGAAFEAEIVNRLGIKEVTCPHIARKSDSDPEIEFLQVEIGRIARSDLKSIVEQFNIRPKVFGDQFGRVVAVIPAVIRSITGLPPMGQSRWVDPDSAARLAEVSVEFFETSDEVDQNLAVQVDQVVALQFDGCIDVKLIRPVRVEFVAQKAFEIVVTGRKVRSFAPNVMKGADLQVPGIADEREFEHRFEQFPGQYFSGGDDFGMPGKFAAETMAGQVADAAADKLRQIVRVPPTIPVERCPDAGPPGFGNVNEQKIVSQ